MSIDVIKPGLLSYKKALELQEELHEKRIRGLINDTLILLEHPLVITLGRRGLRENILADADILLSHGVEIFDVTRGGDVTYHGPGQIVGYPIFDLNKRGRDVKLFVENIEEVFIRLLKNEFDITAKREDKKYTGVWVDNNKITAIGIAVKKWVTMHGFAFNVNTNLEHFSWINPCGITDRGVTSIEKIKGEKQDMNKLNEAVLKYFMGVFG